MRSVEADEAAVIKAMSELYMATGLDHNVVEIAQHSQTGLGETTKGLVRTKNILNDYFQRGLVKWSRNRDGKSAYGPSREMLRQVFLEQHADVQELAAEKAESLTAVRELIKAAKVLLGAGMRLNSFNRNQLRRAVEGLEGLGGEHE